MKLPVVVAVISLAVLTASAPVEQDDKVYVNKDFFPKELVVYKAEHEIVSLFVPINQLNFEEDTEDDDNDAETNAFLFFALADIDENGHKTDKGIYKFHKKVATKLLDNGRDATADSTDTKLAYFGASDGLYLYDGEKGDTTKYGTITDSIIQLVKLNGTDEFYILTESHDVFKVTEAGTKKAEVEVAKGALEITIDFSGNIYFLNKDKEPFVLSGEEAKKISGLPEKPAYGKLVRPAFVQESSVIYISNKKAFEIFSNGTSDISDFVIEAKPSAYAMDAAVVQYYAYDKSIYEYNLIYLMLGELLDTLKSFLQDNKGEIETIASKSKVVKSH